jgi:hypothetical protein
MSPSRQHRQSRPVKRDFFTVKLLSIFLLLYYNMVHENAKI